MKKSNNRILLLLLLCPTIVKANSITAFTYLALYQILFGNIIIALLERYVVKALFKRNLKIIYLIAANYTSMIVGLFLDDFLPFEMKIFIPQNYYSNEIYKNIFLLVILNYFLSILLEYIFYYFSIEKQERTAKSAFIYSMVANSISYLLLLLIYCMLRFVE